MSPAKRQRIALAMARQDQYGFAPNVSRRFHQRALTESHYVDTAYVSYNIDTTGSVTLMATMAQGVSVNQRVGKWAQYDHIELRGLVRAGASDATAEGTVYLVYDKRPTSSLPAVTDILVSATSRSFVNDDNKERFQIVKEWNTLTIGNVTTFDTGREAQNFDKKVSLRGKKIEFNSAGTGAIGDIAYGALYMVVVGNAPAGVTAGTLSVATRTRFHDV